MKNSLAAFLALICVWGISTGCVHTVDGNVKWTPLPFGKDTIESRYEKVPVEKIFNSAKEVLKFDGTLYGENTINHSLQAKVDTRTVYVKVDEVEPNITRVQTQVREKSGAGDIYLASQIDKEIALRLAR